MLLWILALVAVSTLSVYYSTVVLHYFAGTECTVQCTLDKLYQFQLDGDLGILKLKCIS